MPLGEYNQAYQQIKSTAVCSDELSMVTVAEVHLSKAMAAASHMN